MSARCTMSLAAVAALTVATAAPAQVPAGGQTVTTVETKTFTQPLGQTQPLELGQKTPDSLLLARPGVAEDLKLNDAQKGKLAKLTIARRATETEFRNSLNQANQQNFQVGIGPVNASEARREMLAQFNAEADAAVAGMLTPKQRARLFQIGLQVEGPTAFAREDIQAKLNLDPGQSEAIREILEGSGGGPASAAAPMPLADPSTADAAPKARGRGRRADAAAPQPKDEPAPATAATAAASANDPLNDPTLQRIARLLRKKQVDGYKQMRGEPFGPKPASPAATSPTADAEKPAPADAAAAKPAAPATPKAPSRKSLRDRRGGGSGGN